LIEADEDEHAVAVASEPLTDDPSWRTVPNDGLVTVDTSRVITLCPMKLPAIRREAGPGPGQR